MGSPPDETGKNGRYPNETLHVVTLTEPFDLGKYEVTQAQYAGADGEEPELIQGCRPSGGAGDLGWRRTPSAAT